MISPSYEEFLSLKDYIVIRPNGTIHFKYGANKFHTKKFARLTPERSITWNEFQMYYSAINNMVAFGYNPTSQSHEGDDF